MADNGADRLLVNTASPATAHGESTHWPALDGLRAIAVLLVLYNHAPQLLWNVEGNGWWHASRGAWLGVDLFFVLSGFLITSILLHSRGRPGAFRRFWLRRALRIFPLAYAYLAALALVALLPGFPLLRDPSAFTWAALYLLNFHIALHGWPAPEYGLLWSLAVEEHFYLAWPFVALCARPRAVVALPVAAIAAAPLLRLWELPHLGPVGVYVATHCRLDTLAFGALLAVGWHGAARERLRSIAAWLALPSVAWIAWVLGAPMSAVAANAPEWFQAFGYTAVAAAFAVWCTLALEPGPLLRRVLCSALLRRIGRISYGVYVWHVLTASLMRHAFQHFRLAPNDLVLLGAWLAVLFATASISYRWFEAPLLRLKDRIA
jgi:peptidoglycan/LPS O-acetylase OafA/YrhL